jgi:hypothetical protein
MWVESWSDVTMKTSQVLKVAKQGWNTGDEKFYQFHVFLAPKLFENLFIAAVSTNLLLEFRKI